ncbi:MAG: hypothetical protein ACRD63_02715 [Pyrinomonadaceae bacterium]
MRSQFRARSIIAALFLLIVFAPLGIPIFAQAPTPVPSPTAVSGHTLSDNIAALSARASQLLPRLQSEFVSRLITWIDRIAIGLASVILLYSFARLWRESGGVGIDAFWWCVRLGVCLFLLGSGPYLVDQLYRIGKEIAEGNEITGSAGKSMLFEFYKAQQNSFNESYQKFTEGYFTVNAEGETLELEGAPSNSNTGGLLGVVYDTESTVKDIDRKLDVTSYSMPTLFSIFSAARGIVDGGNFWLLILGAFLMIAAKMLAPFAVAVAIDSKLSQKFTYPFVWGTMVLTLFWPAVSYALRALAYFFGNVAMAIGDSDPQYIWDQATMMAVRSPLQHPAYTLVIAAFCMVIIGACLWVSPLITSYLVMGKFYEGVSQVVSGFAGAIISTGVETYSQSAASAVNTQAAKAQADAGYEAETTRADGDYQGASLATRARQITGIAGVHGNQAAQLSQIYAANTNQIMSAQASMLFGINSAGATAALSKAETKVRTAQSIGDIKVDQQKQSSNIETSRAADIERWKGDKIIAGADYLGGLIDGKSGVGRVRGIIGEGVKVGGSAYGLYKQRSSIQQRAEGQQSALSKATEGQIANREQAAHGHYTNQDMYRGQMTQNHQEYAAGQTAASNTAAAQAAGGVKRGAAIQIGGINKGTQMELQGNNLRFDAQVKASDITRLAAIHAARLQALSHVMSTVGRAIAKDIEHGMAMHY